MKNYKDPLIFIVEDDEAYQALIEKTLRSKKFKKIKKFISGNDCIKALDKENPDIVIQDFEMPGINGLETMKKVKKINPAIEFIFLSGQSSIKVAVQSLNSGAYDYIVKDETASTTLVHRLQKLLMAKKLEYEALTMKKGKILLLILLVASWSIILVLYLLGVLI